MLSGVRVQRSHDLFWTGIMEKVASDSILELDGNCWDPRAGGNGLSSAGTRWATAGGGEGGPSLPNNKRYAVAGAWE